MENEIQNVNEGDNILKNNAATHSENTHKRYFKEQKHGTLYYLIMQHQIFYSSQAISRLKGGASV